MITRRDFIRVSSTAGITAFVTSRLGVTRQLFAQIPGGTLDPLNVPKYVTPLLVPPAMPRSGKITIRGGKNADYYEIAMRQFRQQILPNGLPATTVWGYGPNPDTVQGRPVVFHAPSLTIESRYDTPVRIKWMNQLVDENGRYLPHLLPVDQTLHWANPPGGTAGRDSRPTFSATPGLYTGPVPMVTHVHGAVGVGDESDGYAEAWYLPAAANIPSGYANTGKWFEFFKAKAATKFNETWGPGSVICQYPNLNRASTLWYHDHALGLTRLNVYAGPAGFYLLRGGPSDDVHDIRSGRPGVLPGPAPAIGDRPDTTYYEIPLAIQDRSFNSDGSLFYPNTRAFFDQIFGPHIPFTDISPVWNPEFFGNMLMVNGRTWPYLEVESRRYRFRILNGCQSRFLVLDFNAIPDVDVWQIGNDGGFLSSPLHVTGMARNRILMAPAERVDVVVDFTQVPAGGYVLGNVGPDEPFGGGLPDEDFARADAAGTGQVMEFRVVPFSGHDRTTPPRFLELPKVPVLPASTVTRRVALLESSSTSFDDAPAEALLGTVAGDPNAGVVVCTKQRWADPVTENPDVGATETWEIYNATVDGHPIHVHEVAFEVVNRQALIVDDDTGEVQIEPGSTPVPREAGESGFKDTVIAYPGQVTRLRAQFKTPGQFVWHCHIVEHEDNEMMRPFRIGPRQEGQPD